MIAIDVVLAARVLCQFFVGAAELPRARVMERLRVELRIVDQRVDVNVIVIGPRSAFDDV